VPGKAVKKNFPVPNDVSASHPLAAKRLPRIIRNTPPVKPLFGARQPLGDRL